jgi:excinuclease UvrABC nuclease subunit
LSNWLAFDWINTSREFPEAPGVYVIFGDDRLLYIGQSANVYLRILQHRIHFTYSNYGAITPWGTFKSLIVKVRASRCRGDWLMVEHRLIHRLKPEMNCLGGPKPRKPFTKGGK